MNPTGCDECDGTINHHGRGGQSFLWKGMTQKQINDKKIVIPDLQLFNPAPGDMVLDPATKHTLHPAPGCKTPNGQTPTICKSSLRTVNTQAKCGSPDDIYYWTPWRAPGSAPVIDSCGSAGGRFPGMGIGGAGAQYQVRSSRGRQCQCPCPCQAATDLLFFSDPPARSPDPACSVSCAHHAPRSCISVYAMR